MHFLYMVFSALSTQSAKSISGIFDDAFDYND